MVYIFSLLLIIIIHSFIFFFLFSGKFNSFFKQILTLSHFWDFLFVTERPTTLRLALWEAWQSAGGARPKILDNGSWLSLPKTLASSTSTTSSPTTMVARISPDMPKNFQCPRCNRGYKLKSSLRNHEKWECGMEPQFQCQYCPYRAKQKMHVARHIERMHVNKLGARIQPTVVFPSTSNSESASSELNDRLNNNNDNPSSGPE